MMYNIDVVRVVLFTIGIYEKIYYRFLLRFLLITSWL